MVFAIVSRKGGVSKSTLAVHLAVWLYDLLEQQPGAVALIDADDQLSSSPWAREAEPGLRVEAIHDADDLIMMAKKLAKQCQQIVIDCPPNLAEMARAILMVTDLALIPCGPSLLDVRATAQSLKVLESAQLLRDGMPAARFIATKVQMHTNLSKELLENAPQMVDPEKDVTVAKTVMSYRQAYAEAVSRKTVVTRMGAKAKEAALEIDQLFKEVFYGYGSNGHA
jgi:chromosome partitioning protein